MSQTAENKSSSSVNNLHLTKALIDTGIQLEKTVSCFTALHWMRLTPAFHGGMVKTNQITMLSLFLMSRLTFSNLLADNMEW